MYPRSPDLRPLSRFIEQRCTIRVTSFGRASIVEASMPQPSIDLLPFDDFETATRAMLAYLHERLGFSLWIMTRTEGNDWIVLQAGDHDYNVEEGEVFRWADSFCSRMILGRGPRVAPCSSDITPYAAASIGQQVLLCAYLGVSSLE